MISHREAVAADLGAMAGIFVTAWRNGYRGVVPDEVIDALNADTVAADLAARLSDARLRTVLAVDGTGRPAGFVRYGDDVDHPGGGHLAALYVHPAASGAGVGRGLLRVAIDAMAGVDVRLWVFEGNDRARILYERAGFRADGARVVDPRWRTPQVRYLRPGGDRPTGGRAR
jgi:ribosomal protein S18 acetylase RimI-like enzyme